MSVSPEKAWACWSSATSSTTIATLGSIPMLNEKVPMPRRLMLLPVALVFSVMVRLGETRTTSVTLATPRASSWSAVIAVTATGTSCRFCSRRCAVTTMSPSAAESGSAAGSEVLEPCCWPTGACGVAVVLFGVGAAGESDPVWAMAGDTNPIATDASKTKRTFIIALPIVAL